MSRISRRNKLLLLKFLSLFSVVRGYNILIIVLAQYLASVFILSPDTLRARDVVLDLNLFLIVLSTSLVIAGGYIINSFYDSAKDLINRPNKTKLDHMVSQKKILTLYFVLNFISIIVASYVSLSLSGNKTCTLAPASSVKHTGIPVSLRYAHILSIICSVFGFIKMK